MTIESSEFAVVDASIAVKWLIEEENSDLARILVQMWADNGTRLAAPHLMPYEVSNALHRKVNEGRMTPETASAYMDDLAAYRIRLYQLDRLSTVAFELASRFSQRAIYDSYYLALALALDCDFWTADERFYRSVANDLLNVRLISEATAPNQ